MLLRVWYVYSSIRVHNSHDFSVTVANVYSLNILYDYYDNSFNSYLDSYIKNGILLIVQNQCYIFSSYLRLFILKCLLKYIFPFPWRFPDVSNPFKVRLILTLRLSADWMIVYTLTSQYLTCKIRTVNTLVQFAAQLIIYSILPSCFSILPCMYLFFFLRRCFTYQVNVIMNKLYKIYFHEMVWWNFKSFRMLNVIWMLFAITVWD